MLYCPECKIKLEDSKKNCPLCGSVTVSELHLRVDREETVWCDDSILPSDHPEFKHKEMRKKIFFALSILCASGAFVPLVLNFFMDGKITWARYVALSSFLIWAFFAAPIRFYKKKRNPLFFALTLVLFCIVLFAIAFFQNTYAWYFQLAVPLVVLFCIAFLFAWFSIKSVHVHGINVFGIICFICAFLCIGIEFLTDMFLFSSVTIFWSGITAIVLTSLGIIFYLMHYLVLERVPLEKLFRL